MKVAEFPNCEALRIEDLRNCRILDTAPEKSYDGLVKVAASIFDVPISVVSLIDTSRQWFKAKIGLDVAEIPRDISFCSHAILRSDPLIISDATKDERFFDNPLVTESPAIRFYAGAPLISRKGFAYGTLCVIDFVPRTVSDQQKQLLVLLAEQVIDQMERSKLQAQLSDTARLSSLGQLAGSIAHEINTPLAVIQTDIATLKKKGMNGQLSTDKLEVHCNRIANTVQRVAKIIGGLKKYSRNSEADGLQTITIKELLEEAFILCHDKITEKSIQLTVTPFPEGSSVQANETQALQVLLNLYCNAIDGAELADERWIRVDVKEATNFLEIRVKNGGPKIHEDIAEKIFQPFFTTKPIGKGTGLGLSLSIDIMKANGGKLYLDQEEESPCFVVCFPKAQVTEPASS